MAINRTIAGLLALGLHFLCVASAMAQEDDFVPNVGDVQIFDKADLSTYGNGPKHPTGWFIKFDLLQWAVSGPDATTIGAAGFNPELFTGYANVIQPNSMTTDFIDTRFEGGNRTEFGFIRDDVGWIASVFHIYSANHTAVGSDVGVSFIPGIAGGITALEGFVDIDGDGFDDDLNGNNVFGRDGIDLGTPDNGVFIPPLDGIPDLGFATDLGDLANFPVFFEKLYVRNETRIWGTEVMRVWRVCKSPRGVFEVFGGVRYVSYRDKFSLHGRRDIDLAEEDDVDPDEGPISPVFPVRDPLFEGKFLSEVENNLVGPQIGFRLTRRMGGRLTLSHESRLMAAANFQNFRQEGYLATLANPGGFNQPLNLFPEGFNTGSHDVEFAPLGEIRFEANYQLFRSVSIQAGYTAIFADNVARASNNINYVVPGLGINGGRSENIFLNGFNFGVSVNR